MGRKILMRRSHWFQPRPPRSGPYGHVLFWPEVARRQPVYPEARGGQSAGEARQAKKLRALFGIDQEIQAEQAPLQRRYMATGTFPTVQAWRSGSKGAQRSLAAVCCCAAPTAIQTVSANMERPFWRRASKVRSLGRRWQSKHLVPLFERRMAEIGWLAGLRETGFRVPEDVSVIGIDRVLLGECLSSALTTVGQPMLAMANASVELVLARMKQVDLPPQASIFPPELVQRESTGQLRSQEPWLPCSPLRRGTLPIWESPTAQGRIGPSGFAALISSSPFRFGEECAKKARDSSWHR